MGGRRARRLGVVIASLALLTAACGDDDDDAGGSDTGGDSTEEVEALAVSAVDFGFEGLPDEIPGGAVELELTNDGEAEHEIAFVEVGDVTAEQFFEDFGPYIEGGAPAPDYVTNFVGANEAEPGDSAELVYTLSEGKYLAFCALTDAPGGPEGDGAEEDAAEAEEEEVAPHFTLGMVQPVTVTAPEGDAALPEADGSITAVDWSFEADLEAGDTTINFTNDGPDQPHFAGFDRYEEGTTPEEAEAAFAAFFSVEEGQPLPEGTLEGEEIAFSGVATPGNSIQFEVPDGLERGTYVFYCFLSDRSGGPPHALPPEAGGHGMVKAITVE
jgi:hypothetical protein